MRVFLYVACVLDGECLASLTELQGLADELGSAAQESLRWTAKLLSRAADLWPLLPNIPRPLAELISFGVGFIPVVGDLYDLYCGLTGYVIRLRGSGSPAGSGVVDWGGVPAAGVAAQSGHHGQDSAVTG